MSRPATQLRNASFPILTTLLDHHTYPARAIATVYAQRWQAEVVYYRLKVTLRGPGVRLRGQTPALARQEIWGLLTVYNALCDLATQTAVSLGVDPDEISFVAVLRLTRTHLSADTGCRNCGHGPPIPSTRWSPPSPPSPETAPAGNAPARGPTNNAEPNTPATSATPSPS